MALGRLVFASYRVDQRERAAWFEHAGDLFQRLEIAAEVVQSIETDDEVERPIAKRQPFTVRTAQRRIGGRALRVQVVPRTGQDFEIVIDGHDRRGGSYPRYPCRRPPEAGREIETPSMSRQFHAFEQLRQFQSLSDPRAWPAVNQPSAQAMHEDSMLIFFHERI